MYEILLQDLKVMVSNRMGKHLKLFDPILSSKWLFEWQKKHGATDETEDEAVNGVANYE